MGDGYRKGETWHTEVPQERRLGLLQPGLSVSASSLRQPPPLRLQNASAVVGGRLAEPAGLRRRPQGGEMVIFAAMDRLAVGCRRAGGWISELRFGQLLAAMQSRRVQGFPSLHWQLRSGLGRVAVQVARRRMPATDVTRRLRSSR